MFDAQHIELAKQGIARRQRTQDVRGIRRGSRLIQLEIRRARDAGHRR